MERRLVGLTFGILLVAGANPAVGQESQFIPDVQPPPAEHGAGPAIIPAGLAGFVPVVPVPPQLPAAPEPPTRGRSDLRADWSLGNYGTPPRYAAPDLYPPGQLVGWYSGVDIGIMKPNLKSRLTTPATFVGPAGKPITLPTGQLDWTGVPEIALGYRFGQGAGELQLRYRLLASAGHEILPGLDPPVPAQLRTRLDVHTVDLDYISREYLSEGKDISRFFFRDLRAGFGLRAASAFFDARATGAVQLPDTYVSSSFGGVGPRVFFELHQDLGRPDILFYTRVSASGLLGPIRQRFSQTAVTAGGPAAGTFDTRNRNIGIGVLQAEAGLSWEPEPLARRVRLTAAYSWERWWDFGKTDESNAELTLQGVLLRAEFRY